jgi:hypothetical protein
MMTLPGGDASVSFDDLLQRVSKVKSVKTVMTDWGEQISVELSLRYEDTETELSLDFDRGANYLVRRAVANRKNADLRYRAERKVLHFAEPTPGIFFPDSLAEEVSVKDRPEHSSKYALTGIEIDQDIPKSALAITFPHGVDMLDWVQDRTYKVDAAGREIGKSQARLNPTLKPIVAGTATAPAISGRPTPRGEPTREEPRSWTRWILPASLVILLIGASLWFVERRRSAASRAQSATGM